MPLGEETPLERGHQTEDPLINQSINQSGIFKVA